MTSFPEARQHGAVIGLAGYSGSGKTTLAVKIISELTKRGHKVSSIKHAHESFEMDTPGKDSFRHGEAGARQVLVASKTKTVCSTWNISESTGLGTLLGELKPADFVIVEGYKGEDFPKIEVNRNGDELLFGTIPGVFLVASDRELPDCPLPVVHIDDIDSIVKIIEARRDG